MELLGGSIFSLDSCDLESQMTAEVPLFEEIRPLTSTQVAALNQTTLIIQGEN